ncbi:MAG: hypothetical protein ABI646_10690, partial [Acidobacteriota bacterium]
RGKALLEESRYQFANSLPMATDSPIALESANANRYIYRSEGVTDADDEYSVQEATHFEPEMGKRGRSSRKAGQSTSEADPFVDRKSISEVLHDIYDKNVQ